MDISRKSKALLGTFVLVGLAILIGAIVFIGGGAMFSEQMTATTDFQESVQGLEIGSEVKWQGVPIGRVEQITLTKESNGVHVVMSLNVETTGFKDKQELMWTLDREIGRGLRCRLRDIGITGVKFVELDYVPDAPPDNKGLEERLEDGRFYIPSEKSTFAGIVQKIEDTLTKVGDLDLQLTMTKLNTALDSIDAKLKDPRIETILSDVQSTAASAKVIAAKMDELAKKVDGEIDNMQIKTRSDELSAAIKEATTLIQGLQTNVDDAKIPEMAAAAKESITRINEAIDKVTAAVEQVNTTVTDMKLPETVAKGRETMDTGRDTMLKAQDTLANTDATLSAYKDLAALGGDMQQTTQDLRATLDRLNLLIDSLSDDPGALIHGKRLPTTTPDE